MKVTPEYNLGKLRPDLAKEWHPTKNGNLTSYDVSPKSHKKVWWRCNRGHEWPATVYNRSKGSACPYCAGRKATKENNLGVKHPELLGEWHPTKNGNLTPYDLTPRSHHNVWWLCSRGHEWKASAANRSRGTGCPDCHPQTSRVEIRILCELIFNL